MLAVDPDEDDSASDELPRIHLSDSPEKQDLVSSTETPASRSSMRRSINHKMPDLEKVVNNPLAETESYTERRRTSILQRQVITNKLAES